MVPLLAAFVLGMPGGFYEAKVLEPAASFVAKKPVHVYCSLTEGAWDAYVAPRGSGQTGETIAGLTPVVGGAEIEIDGVWCSDLRGAQRGLRQGQVRDLGAALEILTHESIHARGESDEAKTDCAAIHEAPRVAVRFFRVRAGADLRSAMSDAWAFRSAYPPAYHAVC